MSLSGVVSLAVGDWHSCALLSGGSVKCWGNNGKGQLGTGDTIPQYALATVELGAGERIFSRGVLSSHSSEMSLVYNWFEGPLFDEISNQSGLAVMSRSVGSLELNL